LKGYSLQLVTRSRINEIFLSRIIREIPTLIVSSMGKTRVSR
jgi:hypothetical protein